MKNNGEYDDDMQYELEKGKEAYSKSDNKGDDGDLFKASEDESTE